MAPMPIGLPHGAVGLMIAFESEQAARDTYPDHEPVVEAARLRMWGAR